MKWLSEIAKWCTLFLLMAATSCITEKDTLRPVVVVVSPESTPVVNVPDSVLLIAEVSDNREIQSIRVVLVNADKISVASPYMYFPNSTFFRIEQYIHVNDKMLASGEYFILIYVIDGENRKSEYIPLIVNEQPREITGYAALSDQGIMQTRLSYLLPDLSPDTAFNLPLDYSSSGYNDLYGQFYLVSTEPASLIAYPNREQEPEWTRLALPPYPSFSAPFVDKELVLGTGNGEIMALDQEGGVKIISTSDSEKQAGEITADDEYIVCEMTSLNGSKHFLNIYYRVTGGLHMSMMIGENVVAMEPLEEDFLIAMVNMQGSEIYVLEPEKGILTQVSGLENEFLTGLEKVNSQMVLLYTNDKVYRYDLYSNSLTLFLEMEIFKVVFEPLNSRVYCVQNGGVGVYAFPESEQVGFYPFPEPLLDFHILYNK